MSRFQSVVATTSALLTIAVTSVTAYKVFGNQQENSQKQQIIIEDLKHQLEAKAPEASQPITPPPLVLPQPVTPPPPVVPPAPELPIRQ